MTDLPNPWDLMALPMEGPDPHEDMIVPTYAELKRQNAALVAELAQLREALQSSTTNPVLPDSGDDDCPMGYC